MKKMNKKGFTIVELVIVIAVIAILAAVLIPTYTSVVEKANASARLQEARNAYTEYLVDHPTATISHISVTEGSTTYYYAIANDFEVSKTAPTESDAVILASGGHLDLGTDVTECPDCGYTASSSEG